MPGLALESEDTLSLCLHAPLARSARVASPACCGPDSTAPESSAGVRAVGVGDTKVCGELLHCTQGCKEFP